MVYRIFVEKKPEFANEAKALYEDARTLLKIDNITGIRVLNRYDVEGIDAGLFDYAVKTVFSEPQLDDVYSDPEFGDGKVFAVEYLPGQFDQRADSAAQCIQIISKDKKPVIVTAKIYVICGNISEKELSEIKRYVINPVEAREASLLLPETLQTKYIIPEKVDTLNGFNDMSDDSLEEFRKSNGLAMDFDDIKFCQNYFRSEHRDPTITEIKVIDTYWSDHCRHTTFLTSIDDISIDDPRVKEVYDEYISTRKSLGRTKPVCLMDMATLAVRYLKREGKLSKLDESEEINACTVKIEVEVDGKKEPWLLLFKNETHNHPTEIEPFGGAATCIGGAIRDPLSGRSYVYAAMRVTGAADPLKPISETIPGKLPQRKLVVTAANGYSSYGNQIGLATGIVDELYHPGYAAKRMEIGAVIAAAPQKNVKRERPSEGDVVILLGGSTGRDGIGGATGSSKSHNVHSVETCGAEVQKGNAPEERKLQRLFRNPDACRMIKRCNDFGAGGVSVAIGELADGLKINLNSVPKKYEGLDGTELAISESQERMAVVVEEKDLDAFLSIAHSENLQACKVAEVISDPRLIMYWNNIPIVDLSREFLSSNGAEKHISVVVKNPGRKYQRTVIGKFENDITELAADLNICSKRGLGERFDSTIGAGTVLMPYGGKNQLTPIQAMVNKISVLEGDTDDCSVMSWGFNPYVTESDPFYGSYFAVIESVSKLISAGAEYKDIYLSFQEYFEKLGKDPEKWGKPVSALLGAFKAQMDLGIGSIGGKDSMSGTFEDLNVPPTLVSFAVTTAKTGNIISPEFKKPGHKVVLIKPEYDDNGLPVTESLIKNYRLVTELITEGKAVSAYTPGYGGIAEAVLKMSMGNGIGFKFAGDISEKELFDIKCGEFVLELVSGCDAGEELGITTDDDHISFGDCEVGFDKLFGAYESKLESVYSCNIKQEQKTLTAYSFENRNVMAPHVKSIKPKILIPVFPGTNCEYDSAKAVENAGAIPEVYVIRNLSGADISRSVEEFRKLLDDANAVFIPGGFSGGDEPDGSGKFITAFFRNPEIKEGVGDLLNRRDGLMCGICNGFQALIKLGLVPYGKIIDTDINSPTLTFNTIARHQSKIVRTRVASVLSPWLSNAKVGEIYSVPISHGEGRFIASDSLIRELAKNGQIATQYVDFDGEPTADVRFNPNNSMCAIEGISSPDGRVFGKMGHSERVGKGLYKNVPGNYEIKIFESAVKYFNK